MGHREKKGRRRATERMKETTEGGQTEGGEGGGKWQKDKRMFRKTLVDKRE